MVYIYATNGTASISGYDLDVGDLARVKNLKDWISARS